MASYARHVPKKSPTRNYWFPARRCSSAATPGRSGLLRWAYWTRSPCPIGSKMRTTLPFPVRAKPYAADWYAGSALPLWESPQEITVPGSFRFLAASGRYRFAMT